MNRLKDAEYVKLKETKDLSYLELKNIFGLSDEDLKRIFNLKDADLKRYLRPEAEAPETKRDFIKIKEEFNLSFEELKEFYGLTNLDLRKIFGVSEADLAAAKEVGRHERLKKGSKKTRSPEEDFNRDPLDTIVMEGPGKFKVSNPQKEPPIGECPMASVEQILERLKKNNAVTVPPKIKILEKEVSATPGPQTKLSEQEILRDLVLNREIEVSFGSYSGSFFKPGIQKRAAIRVGDFIKNNFGKFRQEETYVEIDTVLNVRKVTGEKGTEPYFEKKVRDRSFDSPDYDYKIYSSLENIIEAPENFTPHMIRERSRFIAMDSTGTFEIALTEISERKADRAFPLEKVELEIELKKNVSLEDLQAFIKRFLLVIQDQTSEDRLITRSEYSSLVNFHNRLVKVKPSSDLAHAYWSKPVNIKVDDFVKLSKGCAVTTKLNGERRILILTDAGVYEYLYPMVRKIGDPVNRNLVGSILDCEVTVDENGVSTFWVFDVLVSGGADIRNKKLLERDQERSYFSVVKLWDSNRVDITKPYFYTNPSCDIYHAFREANNWAKGRKFDGFIYQPQGSYYLIPKKMKPPHEMTIDFLLIPVPSEGEDMYKYMVYDSKTRRNVPFNRRGVSPFIYYHRKGGSAPGIGFVAECAYSSDTATFIVKRERPDKNGSNEISIALDVWDDIIHPISSLTTSGRDLVVMRYVHNRTKEQMLKGLGPLNTLLDFGTGQGGDLKKWESLEITKVLATETREDQIKRLNERYSASSKSFELELLRNADGAPVGFDSSDLAEAVTNSGNTPDAISAFFCLTFFEGEAEVLERIAYNIASVLSVSGRKFIGIVMDGEEVHRLLDSSPQRGKYESSYRSGRNEDKTIFSIEETGKRSKITETFESREIKVSLPGTYVETTEWTFPFGYFKRVLKSNGFILASTRHLSPSPLEVGKIIKKKKPVYSKKVLDELKKLEEFDPGEMDPTLGGGMGGGGMEDKPVIEFQRKEIDDSYASLPEPAKVFSSLQRSFTFVRYKKQKKTHISNPVNSPVEFSSNFGGVDLSLYYFMLYPVVQDHSSIFHAFLEITDPKYYDPQERTYLQEVKTLIDLQEKGRKDISLDNQKAAVRIAKQKIQRARLSDFRVNILPTFFASLPKGFLPKDFLDRYGGIKGLIARLRDLRYEFSSFDACWICARYYSENFSPVEGIILSHTGSVRVTGCEAEEVFIIYQNLSSGTSDISDVERGSLLIRNYPLISHDSDGTPYRLLSTNYKEVLELMAISSDCS